MKKFTALILTTLTLVFVMLGATHLYSDYGSSQTANPNHTVQLEDFTLLSGDDWTGTLSYLDYSSNKIAKIPVKAQFELKGKNTIRYGIQYPGEAYMNSYEKIKISRRGDKLDKRPIVNVTKNEEAFIVTTMHSGKDDNKPAEIRTTYTLSADSFLITKDVKFKGNEDFFNRSEYKFIRGEM